MALEPELLCATYRIMISALHRYPMSPVREFPGTLKPFSTYIKYVAMMLGVIVVLRVVLDLFREVGKVMGV